MCSTTQLLYTELKHLEKDFYEKKNYLKRISFHAY